MRVFDPPLFPSSFGPYNHGEELMKWSKGDVLYLVMVTIIATLGVITGKFLLMIAGIIMCIFIDSICFYYGGENGRTGRISKS